MHIDFDLPCTLQEFENDLLDAEEYVSALRVKHNDGRYLATSRLLQSIVEQYKLTHWKQVYAVLSEKPERHEKNCSCGECYPAFLGRVCYRGYVYSLFGALAVRSKKELFERFASKHPIVSFYGESAKSVAQEIATYCNERRLYLYDPLERQAQLL